MVSARIPTTTPPTTDETGAVITQLNPKAINEVTDAITYPHDGPVDHYVMIHRAAEQAATLGPDYVDVVAESLYSCLQ